MDGKPFTEAMTHRVQRRPRVASGLLACSAMLTSILLLTAAGCSSAAPTETRDDNFTVGDSVMLVVESFNGYIEINAGTDNEVRVEATLRNAPKVTYELSQDGDTITVSAQRTGKRVIGRSPGADITITAPARTDVELDTSNGRIELHGIEGSGYLRTSNGEIVLRNPGIDIDNMEGTAVFDTSNSSVDLQNVSGTIDVETSNGGISFSGEMTAGGSNRLKTSNGSVEVELRGTPSVSIDASTSNGKVKSDIPILATVTEKEHLVGIIGEGEADLRIRTSNGSVTIR